MIAAGGALGGLFVAVAAPLLFTDYYELHCGLLLCGLLFLIACARDRGSVRTRQVQASAEDRPNWPAWPGLAALRGPDACPARRSVALPSGWRLWAAAGRAGGDAVALWRPASSRAGRGV